MCRVIVRPGMSLVVETSMMAPIASAKRTIAQGRGAAKPARRLPARNLG
jgi:hypothetical protein